MKFICYHVYTIYICICTYSEYFLPMASPSMNRTLEKCMIHFFFLNIIMHNVIYQICDFIHNEYFMFPTLSEVLIRVVSIVCLLWQSDFFVAVEIKKIQRQTIESSKYFSYGTGLSRVIKMFFIRHPVEFLANTNVHSKDRIECA